MKRIIFILLILTLLLGCSKNKMAPNFSDKMAAADNLYAKGKYARAATLYEDITFERRTFNTANAYLKQADCYFRLNKFTDARLKYAQMVEMFPDHPDTKLAYFRIGVCYYEESLPPQYDQSETVQAIEAFKIYLEKFPNADNFAETIDYIRKAQAKLIQKTYYNGYIYYRMKDYSSALMYLNEVTELDNTDKFNCNAYYYTVLSHKHQHNLKQAQDVYQVMQSKYPNAKQTRRLAKLFKTKK